MTTFGLSVSYLGLSLGYTVALGFCAAFGTVISAIYDGKLPKQGPITWKEDFL